MLKGIHLDRLRRLWSGLKSARARVWLRLLGLTILIAGCVWSFLALDLRFSELQPFYLLLNLIVLSPILLCIAGITLNLTGRALGVHIRLADAVQAAALANVAELLPLPGGALVRGAVLTQAGAGIAESASMIVATSVLTLFMAVSLSAGALAFLGQPIGWWLAGAGMVGVCVALWWLSRRTLPRILVLMFAIRVVTIGVNILRLILSFAAIGIAAGLSQVSLLSVSTSLGSAVAIVPAGFGVNEAIAAALATLVSASPAAAFLAVALNRALGLGAGAILGALFALFRGQKA